MEPLYCNIRDKEDKEDLIVKAKLQIYIHEEEENKPSLPSITKPFNGSIEIGDEHLFDLNETEYTRIHQILSASKLLITTHLFGRMVVGVYGISISDYRIVIDIQGQLKWWNDFAGIWQPYTENKKEN